MFVILLGFTLFFLANHTARGLLIPQPEMESETPAMEAQSLNSWTAREVPGFTFFKFQKLNFLEKIKVLASSSFPLCTMEPSTIVMRYLLLFLSCPLGLPDKI